MSRSPLESWYLFSKFLFLFSKWKKFADFSNFFCKNSRSLLEPENRSQHFSFLFSKFEIWIPYFSFSSRFHFLASLQCLLVQLKNLQYNILYWKWSHPHFALVKKSIQFGMDTGQDPTRHLFLFKLCPFRLWLTQLRLFVLCRWATYEDSSTADFYNYLCEPGNCRHGCSWRRRLLSTDRRSQQALAHPNFAKLAQPPAQYQGFSSPACSWQHRLLPCSPPRRWRVALSALALTFSSMEGGWAGQQGPGGSRHSPTNTSPPPLLPDRVHNPTHCPTCLLYFAQQFDWPDLVNWRGSLLCFLLPIRLPRSFPGESEPFEESSDWLSLRVIKVLSTDRL